MRASTEGLFADGDEGGGKHQLACDGAAVAEAVMTDSL